MSDRLFHKTGLIYFWVLNDACDDALVDKMIDAFAQANVAAVCLHPRPGLLLPYGGDAWFEFIKRTVEKCNERELPVWLYDEDPYPSGACGGWITAEHPEYRAMDIEQSVYDAQTAKDNLFGFAAGKLLWCGLVNQTTGQTVDLTSRVGMVRRHWLLLDPWDSKYYYPNTPLYSCPRSDATVPEFALQVPSIEEGFELMAFVARPAGGADACWGALPDTLNPKVTQLFLAKTHDRYQQSVGQYFGKQIKAIFTDEPKYFGYRPWTPATFEGYQSQFGHDLRPQLWRLFNNAMDKVSLETRLNFRQWCGQRFESAWLKPVGQWCREHNIALVGHISPEDDVLQQAACVSNLFPLFKHFDIPGIDLIIPAVGDKRHPILNVGVVSAVSVAQQQNKPGVLSETLGASGLDMTVENARRILLWQMMMGVTTHVVHGAFNSTEDLRIYDAPPDFGPNSERWSGMVSIADELAELQPLVRDSRQVAPVAIIWPIRSFCAAPIVGYTHEAPMRDELNDLLALCLDHQVGVHFIDEQVLCDATIDGGCLHVGLACYSHVLIPTCSVLHDATLTKLKECHTQGVAVIHTGNQLQWRQTEHGVEAADLSWCPSQVAADAVQSLPRLVNIESNGDDIRCTTWQKNDRCVSLLMNLKTEPAATVIDGKPMTLKPEAVYTIESPHHALREVRCAPTQPVGD